MANSYTTDYRLERVVKSDSVSADEAVDGTFVTKSGTHSLGYQPYFRYYTTYPNGTTVAGAPYIYKPQAVFIQPSVDASDVDFFIENYVSSGVVNIDYQIYTEKVE